jgi:hypothetical protein
MLHNVAGNQSRLTASRAVRLMQDDKLRSHSWGWLCRRSPRPRRPRSASRHRRTPDIAATPRQSDPTIIDPLSHARRERRAQVAGVLRHRWQTPGRERCRGMRDPLVPAAPIEQIRIHLVSPLNPIERHIGVDAQTQPMLPAVRCGHQGKSTSS